MNNGFSSSSPTGDRPAADTPSTNGQSGDPSILLIDDNPAVARAMEIAFRIAGHRLDTVAGPQEAYSRLASRRYGAILLDMNFTQGSADGEEGLACLKRIIADDPGACVVAVTAHSGIRIAVAAMQAGARDFVMKPWRNAELIAKVTAAMARVPVATPATPRAGGVSTAMLLGESPAMARLRDLIRRVGPSGAGVTITGRPGSGRMLAARALHAASGDPGEPLRIDLRDGAAWNRLDTACGGGILRHPDRIDAVAQDRLLDRLPGGVRPIAIVEEVALLTPALRRRLATVEIAVPPLASRGDDVLLLARHFARDAAERFGRGEVRLTPAAEAAIRAAAWPDEVRGLALAIERAVLLGDDGAIDAAAVVPPPPVVVADPGAEANFALSDAERAVIEAALREHRHNVTHAATALGLSRGALYRRMARYGL